MAKASRRNRVKIPSDLEFELYPRMKRGIGKSYVARGVQNGREYILHATKGWRRRAV